MHIWLLFLFMLPSEGERSRSTKKVGPKRVFIQDDRDKKTDSQMAAG
jgi:hypothetical protein